MVPGGPWHVASFLSGELQEIFSGDQATSNKQQAASHKLATIKR
jgi:hypothetical protein